MELSFPTAFERLHTAFYRSKLTSWMAAQEEDYRCAPPAPRPRGARPRAARPRAGRPQPMLAPGAPCTASERGSPLAVLGRLNSHAGARRWCRALGAQHGARGRSRATRRAPRARRFMLLEADAAETPWSRICVAQADCILLIAAEDAGPQARRPRPARAPARLPRPQRARPQQRRLAPGLQGGEERDAAASPQPVALQRLAAALSVPGQPSWLPASGWRTPRRHGSPSGGACEAEPAASGRKR